MTGINLFGLMKQGPITVIIIMRKHGYAIRGKTPVYHRKLIRGKRISAIAAISSDGLVACECTTGTVDSEIFFNFVRGCLIPQMHPFDGSSPKSILIMDNCTIHHVPEIATLLASVTFFLPPYSPDYNPIEETFSYLKNYLKHHDQLQCLNDPTVVIKHALNTFKRTL